MKEFEKERLPDIRKKSFSVLLLNEITKSRSLSIMFLRIEVQLEFYFLKWKKSIGLY